jgi:hypothetical protein
MGPAEAVAPGPGGSRRTGVMRALWVAFALIIVLVATAILIGYWSR